MESREEFYNTVIQSLESIICELQDESENSVCHVITQLESIILTQDLEFILPMQIINLIESAIRILTFPEDNHTVGRPKIVVPVEQLQFLLSIRLKAVDIAKIYNISRSTLFERMKEHNISVSSTYSQITDESLNAAILNVLRQFPNTGYKRMKGYLRSHNIHVTDYRVRIAMRDVDPVGVYQRTLRRNRTIRRRTYFVKYSNELWHIDGNLKLNRWGIVIRCAIDGKSRVVTYLSATNNNRADTHVETFLKAVSRYGIPFRTRSDKGGENVMIAKFMIENRGLDRASHICGRSVHNQRIERYWRDVMEGCTSVYYNLFYQLEEDGLMDIDNPYHLWLLQHIFLPRLNSVFETFVDAWNHHPLSTEGNRTPLQLMLMNLPPPEYDLTLTPELLDGMEFSCDGLEDLGRFDEINNPEMNRNADIRERDLLEVLGSLDILAESDNHGYEIFTEALHLFSMAP